MCAECRPRKSAPPWASRHRTSGCCCTGPGRCCALPSRATTVDDGWHRGRVPGGNMTVDLSGQAALITGAAAGIGRASALAFAAAGASVALVDIDGDGLAGTAAAARACGARAEVL